MNGSISFGVGFKSNKETNDFLRCLWSRMSTKFGKLAWLYSPLRIKTTINIGQASIGEDKILDIKLHYNQRGCLARIEFVSNGEIEGLKSKLKQCVCEALQYEKYEMVCWVKGHLDKNLSFIKRTGKNFGIEGTQCKIRVKGYDQNDCFTMTKAQILQVCNLLTFDTLKYISLAGSLTEEIRKKHNFVTSFVNESTGVEFSNFEKNERYRNLTISDDIAEYIDAYLERPYEYEEHFTDFDKSVQLFAQGIRNEELSDIATGLPEPFVEQAIVNYMSALEVITLKDKEPDTCKCCGQKKYSIARRVIDIANAAKDGLGDFVKNYYRDRSKYVHTGALLSNNSYIGRSIPLMSKVSETGMITQVGRVPVELKEMVKACIEWHEGMKQ